MIRRILSLFPVLAMGVLSGCGDGGSHVDTTGPVQVSTAPAETVLVKFGEKEITVGDFRRRQAFEKGLYTFKNSKAAKSKDFGKKLEQFERRRQQQIVPQLVRNALLNGYLDAACGGRGVTNAEAVVAKFLRGFGPRAVKLGLEGLAKEIGAEVEDLRDEALLGAREAKASLMFDPLQTTVSEKEIDEGLARLDAYKAMVAATNAASWAACSNALQEVRAGADFVAVAKRYCTAEDAKEAEDWGWYNRDDFDLMAKRCPAFKRWAFSAKVGDIGGPFDIDDGLSIVKVAGHQEGSEKPSTVSKQVEEVQLVRINFPMMEENTEPRTREHCREALLAWKKRDAQARLFTQLFNDAKVAYPNGDKLDFKGGK